MAISVTMQSLSTHRNTHIAHAPQQRAREDQGTGHSGAASVTSAAPQQPGWDLPAFIPRAFWPLAVGPIEISQGILGILEALSRCETFPGQWWWGSLASYHFYPIPKS